ncbi:MAG: ATPase, T2SS/T4P/T4SS family, partial [Gammaproteobacteria bacterium]
VNKILLDAVAGGISDVHLEPYESSYRIRFRSDGLLHEVARPPLNLAGRIAARIKIMASLDISEKRSAQDGRIRLRLPQSKAIDFRVNTLPTLWGEKIVLRLLGSSRYDLNMDGLGFSAKQKQQYLEALNAQQGMILVTGPTGSGKTVTLYSGLRHLNTETRYISTAEDPVEINLEGINQVAMNPRNGIDFAAALRAFLRQDPDVIMVGEIRDAESADIAVKAAQTGHLVLSTLHTNNAADTLVRLRNMGIADYNLAASISLIMAQRLLRRLCNHCKESRKIPEKVLLEEGFTAEQLERAQIHGAVGCKRCNSGYRGRLGIYEVVPINPALNRIIMAGGNTGNITECARQQGFLSLRQAALDKVARGLTSLDEANRLTR